MAARLQNWIWGLSIAFVFGVALWPAFKASLRELVCVSASGKPILRDAARTEVSPVEVPLGGGQYRKSTKLFHFDSFETVFFGGGED